eukprot:4281283-Prymnesium_polylepis.1
MTALAAGRRWQHARVRSPRQSAIAHWRPWRRPAAATASSAAPCRARPRCHAAHHRYPTRTRRRRRRVRSSGARRCAHRRAARAPPRLSAGRWPPWSTGPKRGVAATAKAPAAAATARLARLARPAARHRSGRRPSPPRRRRAAAAAAAAAAAVAAAWAA